MILIKCNITGKVHEIIKQDKWQNLPYHGLEFYTTAFTNTGVVYIYYSKSFALYAKPPIVY